MCARIFISSLHSFSTILNMCDDSLDTDILKQFVAPVAAAAVLVPLVVPASPEQPAPTRRASQYTSTFALSATASVVKVDATQGELVMIDTSTAAASGETEEEQGSRLDQTPKTLSSSIKAEYSLCYLAEASNVCGAQIGVKVDALFCLKAVGPCLVTAHKGRHTCCIGNHLFLNSTCITGNEMVLHPQSYSYILENDNLDDEYE